MYLFWDDDHRWVRTMACSIVWLSLTIYNLLYDKDALIPGMLFLFFLIDAVSEKIKKEKILREII